jgi:hypothetical protein
MRPQQRNGADGAELRILRSELLEAHRELARLRVQTEQLMGSNRDLSSLLIGTEKRSGELVKIIVAFRRLLESEDASAALRCIEEILINVIGTEEFVVLLITKGETMRPVAGHGAALTRAHATSPTLEELRAVDARVVPLYIADTAVGALAIHELLPHRDPLNQNDDQVLNLLSKYAATVVMAAEHRKHWTRVTVAEVA